MLRSIGKQSGECVQSVLEKKGQRWEGFAEKGGFIPGTKECGSDGILIIISMNVSSITSV